MDKPQPTLRQPPTAFELLQLVQAKVLTIAEARHFLLGDSAEPIPDDPSNSMACPLCKSTIKLGTGVTPRWPVRPQTT